ncbi:hypothetical protein [Flindersiella endophytica]
MDEDTRKGVPATATRALRRPLQAAQDETAELDQFAAQPAHNGRPDPGLLDRLPTLRKQLSKAPEQLQRDLYDALRLQVVYSYRRKEAHLKVTITDESAETLTTATRATAAGFADLLSAPRGAPKDGTWADQQFSVGSLIVEASFELSSGS